ncbi:hypothetical protein JCM10213v2_004871 [Rhodosporidiobolus nylandii]
MACGAFVQCSNLVFLAVLVGATAFYMWPSIIAFKFSTDVGGSSQVIGVCASAVSFVLFILVWVMGPGGVLAVILCVTAILDVLCYAVWSMQGTTDMICNGAEETASKVGVDASQYIQCNAEWMHYVLWVLICISGSLQLSVATSALNCSGGSNSNALGKRSTTASAARHPAVASTARSLGQRRRKSSRLVHSARRSESDEEAALPLREEKQARRGEGGRDSDSAEEAEMGRYSDYDGAEKGAGGRRASVALSRGGGLSEEEEGLEGGERMSGGRY